jgi:hypothetical protein
VWYAGLFDEMSFGMIKLATRLCRCAGCAAVCLLYTSAAEAQFRPRPLSEPPASEVFWIEASAAIWRPSADVAISSEAFGIRGTTIDFKQDLGLTDKSLPELKLTLQPLRNHKLRAQVIPIKYESSIRLTRDIIFNGQRYSVSLPVNSTVDWKFWRFNYEFDFISKNRGFAGFIVEMRYNDFHAELTTPSPSIREFTRRRFPAPALGGIARVHVVPNISITGEVTGFKIPNIDRHTGNYVDVDIYGTANFMRNVGAQVGFRSTDLGYQIEDDTGSLTLKGIYFGIVARY